MTRRVNRPEYVSKLVSQVRDDRLRLFKGRFRSFDQALGVSTGYLSTGLNGSRQLRVDRTFKAVALLGFEPGEYLDRLESGRTAFQAMPPGFLASRRRKDRKTKPLKAHQKLMCWSQEVEIDPTGKNLRFELDAYTSFFGLHSEHGETQFGNALLTILAESQPRLLTKDSIQSVVGFLNRMAQITIDNRQYGRALDLLEIAFLIESRLGNFDLRAKLFGSSAAALSGLGFPSDARWCGAEALILCFGNGDWSEIRWRLSCLQEEVVPDATSRLLQSAADERRASILQIDRKEIDKPLGGDRAFDRLLRGKLRSTFTLDRWSDFESRLLNGGVRDRAFRSPFLPPPGGNALQLLHHESLSGEGLPQRLEKYLAKLRLATISQETRLTEDISIVYPSPDEAELLARSLRSTSHLTKQELMEHILALASTAHRMRLNSNLKASKDLFLAAFELEASLESHRLRAQLHRLAAYLFRDLGAFNDAHIFVTRAVNGSLISLDQLGLAQALYSLGMLEALAGRYAETKWLLSGCCQLADLAPSYSVWVHHGLAYANFRLGEMAESETALLRAECLSVDDADGHIAFLRGALSMERMQLEDAEMYFRHAKVSFDASGSVVDRLLWGLYFSEYLVRSGQPYRAFDEIRQLYELARTDSKNKLVKGAVHGLSEIARQGEITLTLLRRLCEQIERPWRASA